MPAKTLSELHESWRTTVDRLTEQLQTTSQTAPSLQDGVEALIEAAIEQSHSDWELNTPCPDCGNEHLTRWVTYPELARHEDGYSTFRDGSSNGYVFAWDCPDCETILATSPAALLIPTAPGEVPDLETNQQTVLADTERDPACIATVRDGIIDQQAKTDWRHGNECPFCDSHFIGEYPLDAYTATIGENGFTQGSYGERLTTVRCWCDSCGEHLREEPGGFVMDYLTL